MKAYNFPLDYFGVIADVKVMQLIQQSGDRRKRKSALNALVGIAKMAGAIERKETVEAVGLLVDSAGQIFLSFQCKNPPINPLNPPPGFGLTTDENDRGD